MATSTTINNSDNHHKQDHPIVSTVIIDPMNINNNTTFVQADPSTFRAVVQKLTGVTENPLFEKLPVTTHSNLPSPRSSSAAARSNGSRNSSFKLHERRQYHNNTMRKLEIGTGFVHHQGFSTSNALMNYHQNQFRSSSACCFNGGDQKKNMVLMSPVSTLDHHFFPSPRTPRSPQEEEEKAISEKGFYLHPSPRSKSSSNPQLLPLFPLTSPRDSSSSSS